MDVLDVSFSLDIGETGEDSNNINPWSRSLNQLLSTGRPFKRVINSFFWGKENCKKQKLRWFGVFVLTEGDRVLFFPGFKTIQKEIKKRSGTSYHQDQDFLLDHLSLEKDFANYHATDVINGKHFGNENTKSLGDNRFLWFGLSVQKTDDLRILKKKTTASASIHPNDSSRRVEIITESRKDAIFQILHLHSESLENVNTHLHFAVIVGEKGFPEYLGSNLGFPTNSPFIQKVTKNLELEIPTRIHRLNLSDKIDIQIVTCTLKGELNSPILIST